MPQNSELRVNRTMQIRKKRLRPNEAGQPAADRKDDGVRDQIGREHPGALVVARAEVPGHMRQRDVGDAGVEHFHERGHRDHHRDQPGIVFRLPGAGGSGARRIGQSARLLDIDLGNDGHAGPQPVIVVLARIDIDADGNALHHLHVISGGVFGRQQAEARTARAADAGDLAACIRGRRRRR